MTAAYCAQKERNSRLLYLRSMGLFLLFLVAVSGSTAQDREDFDAHTFRIEGFWFYSQPSGSFHGSGNQGFFDLRKDVNFNSYNTAAGKLEWKFTRKNHLSFSVLPVNQSKQFVLDRTIVFEAKTFDVGLAASGRLQNYLLAPAYQYDIIRRQRGHIGVVAQIDLFYIQGTLSTAAQVSNGIPRFAQTSSGTLRAPLPVAGPDVRYYLIPHSSRLFASGDLLGMYFFGYGNFISSFGTLGLTLNKHFNLQGGYEVSSRLNIQSKSDRIGLNLTQRGAIAGLEVSF